MTLPADRAVPAHAARLGLQADPFPVTPDERHYFFTPATEAVLQELRHFLEMRRGLLVLTGEVGLGKTTLLRRLLSSLDPARFNTSLVLTGFLGGDELLAAIAADFGLGVPAAAGRLELLDMLNAFLLAQTEAGRINVVVVDDAQALAPEALETVRQLGNLETASAKLVQLVLCGQQELLATLEQPGLRQVRSRVALCRELAPLDFAQTQAYIRHRLTGAGGSPGPRLSQEAVEEIHRLTGGSPRAIHHLMDRCLYALMARGTENIDAALVREARDDLAWHAPAPLASPVRATPRRMKPWAIAGAAGAASLAAAWAFVAPAPAPPPMEAVRPPVVAAAPTPSAPAWAETVAAACARPVPVPAAPLGWGESHPALRGVQDHFVRQRWIEPAAADGLMGGRTAGAVSRFQSAEQLPPTGQFDPRTAARLGCAIAAAQAGAAR